MDSGPRLIACAVGLLAAMAPQVEAQNMFKCRDGRGQVTYSNVTCEKQGLKDAGAVANRTTTLPMAPAAQKAAAPRDAKAAPGPSRDDSEIGPMQSPAQIKPVNPLIERLLK